MRLDSLNADAIPYKSLKVVALSYEVHRDLENLLHLTSFTSMLYPGGGGYKSTHTVFRLS